MITLVRWTLNGIVLLILLHIAAGCGVAGAQPPPEEIDFVENWVKIRGSLGKKIEDHNALARMNISH